MPTPPTAWSSMLPESATGRYANFSCPNGFPVARMRHGHRARSCAAGTPSTRPPARPDCSVLRLRRGGADHAKARRHKCRSRVLGLLGDEWTLLIIRQVLLGAIRYGEFMDRLPIS